MRPQDNARNPDGIDHMGARFYDPTIGRWTQQDPIFDPASPQGWDRYVYVGDDPVNHADPTGQQCGWDVFHAFEGIEGAAWSGVATFASGLGLAAVLSAGGATAIVGGITLGVTALGFAAGALGLLAFAGYSIYQASQSC